MSSALKVAVVTGVCGGIGASIASHFRQEGWIVAGLDLLDHCTTEDVAQYFPVDLADEEAVDAGFAKLSTAVDHVDVLVNNAAVALTKPLLETTVDEWDEVMATNARAALLCTQRAYPLMRSHGGAIVNVASVHAIATSLTKGAYSASKSALVALTRALALELAPSSIRVNAVIPGAVATSMLRPPGREEEHDAAMDFLVRRTPMQRVAEPKEIASVVYFLATGDSSYITGEGVVVDGGVLARLATE